MLRSVKIPPLVRIMALIIAMSTLLHQNCLADYTNPSTGDETNVAYWIDLGGLYSAYGNYSAAVEAYKKALVLSPNDSTVFFNLSLVFCEMGLYEDSLDAIKRAISTEPQNGDYYYGQGWILVKAGRAAEARALFQHAADLGVPDAVAYMESQN